VAWYTLEQRCYDQFDLSELLSCWTGKFGQLLALENAAGVDAGLTVRAVRLPPQLIGHRLPGTLW
jgi:hypothetical protein